MENLMKMLVKNKDLPEGATSLARARVIPSRAALVAE